MNRIPGQYHPPFRTQTGDAAFCIHSCSSVEGFVSYHVDWNDTDPAVYPGTPAQADGKDRDSDGVIDRVSLPIG